MFTAGGVSGVTAGQVSAHILFAGQSDKGYEGTTDMWPNSAEGHVENLRQIDDSPFTLLMRNKHGWFKMSVELSGNPDKLIN